jgi:hypothetical protein
MSSPLFNTVLGKSFSSWARKPDKLTELVEFAGMVIVMGAKPGFAGCEMVTTAGWLPILIRRKILPSA